MKLASLIAVAGIAAAASAQNTMTYSWTVSDTELSPGESATLTLWATMAPGKIGFAGSIYDIIGGANWNTGVISGNSNLVDSLATGPGDLQANNDITGIEAFQLPPFFNPSFNAGNPIALYSLTWTPNDYTARTVGVADANHINNDVYTDTFGSSQAYQGVTGATSFNVVPAPASLALLGLGGLVARRRR